MISDADVLKTHQTWLKLGKSRAKTADELKLSIGAVQRRLEAVRDDPTYYAAVKVAGIEHEFAVAEGEKPSKFDARFVRLQDENSTLKRELKQAIRDNLDTEKVRREIIGVTAVPPNPPTWTTDLKGRDHSGPGIPMTIWSDWHWGEVVKREEVGGVNEFNIDIAKRRAKRLLDTTIKLAFNHQVHKGYPGLVLMLGGDMITGEIHGELADTNEMKTIPACYDLLNVLIAMITELSKHFPKLFIPCVVGNHGRNTLKPRMKSKVHTNYEWLIYVMLEKHFENNPKIEFFIPNDIDVLLRVNNTRYLLTHGDALGVKGGDGIIGSLGPIMRGRIKVGNSYSHIGRDFDVMVQGHWHQYLPMPECITNGSLKGYCDFARTALRATFQRPIQAMWYDHPKIGVTKHEPIYLENMLGRPADQADAWVSHFAGGR